MKSMFCILLLKPKILCTETKFLPEFTKALWQNGKSGKALQMLNYSYLSKHDMKSILISLSVEFFKKEIETVF